MIDLIIFFFKNPLNLYYKTVKAKISGSNFFQHQKNQEGNHPTPQLSSENQEVNDFIKNEDLCYESEKETLFISS